MPDPKRETGVFYNAQLENFYKSFWPVCPDKPKFKKAFIAERSRQWDIKKQLNSISDQIEYFKSDNPAMAGRYLQQNFTPKRSDSMNIERLLQNLENKITNLTMIKDTVKQQDDLLFNVHGRMKSGRMSCHAYNEETFVLIKTKETEINNLKCKLSESKCLAEKLTCSKKQTSRSKQKRKRENDWKIENRAKKSKRRRSYELFEALGGEGIEYSISPEISGVNQITEITLELFNDVFPSGLKMRDISCLKYLIEIGCFRGMALEFISEKVF